MGTKLLVVHWQWGPNSKHAGASFWSAHNTDIDGRIVDWPTEDLIPLGASEVTITDGVGLHLMQPIAERTVALRVERGWGSGSVRTNSSS
jgi:hypothetical protein